MPAASALLGEDRVDLAAGLVEQLADPALLAFVGSVEDLADRVVQLADRFAQVNLLRVGLGADRVPGSLLAGSGLALGLAGVGEREAALAVDLDAVDQALVLEQLQGRVDRAGARRPGPPVRSSSCLIIS